MARAAPRRTGTHKNAEGGMDALIAELERNRDEEKRAGFEKFFKTGPGQYGHGDVFLGLSVPQQREIVKRHELSLDEIGRMLQSPVHEHRMCALFILVRKFEKAGDEAGRREIYDFYLRHARRVNNWDLVDLSAPRIVGAHLRDKRRDVLDRLAASQDLWERRISVVATYTLIKDGQLEDTMRICRALMSDGHDLIHKACGWMLRETGKKDERALRRFLDDEAGRMPRTMLRYAIERLDEKSRRHYMGLRRHPGATRP